MESKNQPSVGESSIDVQKAIVGIWTKIPGYGFELRIGKYSNSRYRMFQQKHIDRGWDQDESVRAYLGGEVITGVRGMKAESGEDVEWSEAFGIDFLLERAEAEHPVTGEVIRTYVREDLGDFAYSLATQSSRYLRAAAGNSSPSSVGEMPSED